MTPPFAVQKIGHAVINVTDLEASKRFYTDVLGFRISDVYEGNKMPGGMVFLRCNADHHCLALIVGAAATAARAQNFLYGPTANREETTAWLSTNFASTSCGLARWTSG